MAEDTKAPDSLVVEIAQAVIDTYSEPSIANIMKDVELAIKLVRELKESLKDIHPSIMELVRQLF